MFIRDAGLDDLDGIMAIEHASFPTDAWSSSLMRDELDSEHTQYVVLADKSGGLHGYAGLRALKGSPDSDVQTIAVAESARGSGYGRALLRELLVRAINAGAREVFLDVRDDNTPAQTLYASEGFVELGRRPGYYQPDNVDAVVMRLQLTQTISDALKHSTAPEETA